MTALSPFRDLKYALRNLAKAPGLTIAIVLSISLGIAANTTVFSLTNTLLFGSLPVDEPSRLVSIDGASSKSWVEYNEFREQSTCFEDVSARFVLLPASLGGGEPERIWGQAVTANYFDVLGLELGRGRGFLPEEGEIGNPVQVVVITDALWQRRFGSREDLLGSEIVLNNRNYTVAGITPPGFHGEDRGLLADFWVPLPNAEILMPKFGRRSERYEDRGTRWLALTARLRPSAAADEAEAEINVIRNRNDEAAAESDRERRALALSPAGGLPGGAEHFVAGLVVILLLVVGLVLLIACANVANILLARATGRQKEIGIRLAIGASRGRIIRQLLTESFVLSTLGAGAGVGFAYLATAALSDFQLPLPIPISLNFTPDVRVLLATAGLSVITGLTFGLAPALRSTNPNLVTALKGQATGFARVRRFSLRSSLVVIQVTLSIVLLVSAGLFLRSLRSASTINLGMNPDNVLIMGFDPGLHSYTPERTRQFVGELRQRVEALPGVRSVSFVDTVPLSIGGHSSGFSAGIPSEETEQRASADIYTVSSSFLETMGVEFVRGRDFTPGLDLARDTAIIDRSLAESLFPGEDPLGRTIRGSDREFEVIGITADLKSRTLGEGERHTVFSYLDRNPEAGGELFGYNLLAKTNGDPRALIGAIRATFRELDPAMAVVNVETMREHVDDALLFPRVTAVLLGVFGTVGLVLALIGLYGVMSYSVRQQRKDIGIRMALGAPSKSILKGVVSRGMILTSIGIAAGLPLATAAGQLYGSYLHGVSATDALTYVAVPLILLIGSFLSTAIPAGRAARVNPSVALRND